MAASLLTRTSAATSTQVTILAALDFLLLLALWGCVLWAFGWESLCVAAIFWGTNFPARFYWTGGSFLRQDWLFFSILSICLLKRERPFAAGAALAYASLLRIFPAFLAIPLLIKMASLLWRERRFILRAEHKKFLLGGLLVGLVTIPLSIATSGHPAVWFEFYNNSEKHLRTPLTNNMGLKTVISYEYESRAQVTKDPAAVEPYGEWKNLRLASFSKRQWIFWGILLATLIFFWRLTPSLPDWMVLVTGVGLIPLGAELTCYYYSILLAFGLLWKEYPWAGVGLAFLSWLTCQCAWMSDWYDESFTWMSALTVFYILAVYAYLYRHRNHSPPFTP